KGPPSSLVQLRTAVWTGDARDTRRVARRNLTPRALPEPCVNLSIHTAPDVRPLAHAASGFTSSTGSSRCQMASVGLWSRLNNAAPSLRSHYRTFITTTGRSVPVLRIGTLILAVCAACNLSLCIGGQVLTFRTRAWLSFAPPTCRMPLGQASGFPQADPGGRVTPRFWHRLIRFRHFIDGLLALASLNLACRNLVPAFPQRSPPSLFTTAACGGLRPEPDFRPRRALLHLSYSCAPPFGPTILVTHDPTATMAVHCGNGFDAGSEERRVGK